MTKDQQYKIIFENWKKYSNSENTINELEDEPLPEPEEDEKPKYGTKNKMSDMKDSSTDSSGAAITAIGLLPAIAAASAAKDFFFGGSAAGGAAAGAVGVGLLAKLKSIGIKRAAGFMLKRVLGPLGLAWTAWDLYKAYKEQNKEPATKEDFNKIKDNQQFKNFVKEVRKQQKQEELVKTAGGRAPGANAAGALDTVDLSDSDTISYKGQIRTHGSKGKHDIIPGMKNAKDLYPRLLSSGLFTVLRGNPERYGNPWLASVIIQAAKGVDKKSGIPQVRNISLKNGGPIKPSKSHQVGLDVDITFYRTDGKSNWFNAVKDFNLFDVNRNIEFMYYLSQDQRTKMIFIDRRLISTINGTSKSQKHATMWNKARKSGKIKPDNSHDDHYHIRVFHPPNSITVAHGNRNAGVGRSISISPTRGNN